MFRNTSTVLYIRFFFQLTFIFTISWITLSCFLFLISSNLFISDTNIYKLSLFLTPFKKFTTLTLDYTLLLNLWHFVFSQLGIFLSQNLYIKIVLFCFQTSLFVDSIGMATRWKERKMSKKLLICFVFTIDDNFCLFF